jgi:hypothetical protein
MKLGTGNTENMCADVETYDPKTTLVVYKRILRRMDMFNKYLGNSIYYRI